MERFDRNYSDKSADRIWEHVSIGISIETILIRKQIGFLTMFRLSVPIERFDRNSNRNVSG